MTATIFDSSIENWKYVMKRFQSIAVGLNDPNGNQSLIRFATMICGLGPVRRIQFLHVLPSGNHPDKPQVHDQVQKELQDNVFKCLGEIDRKIDVSCVVLNGPLLDRYLSHVAEHNIDLIIVGHGPDSGRRRTLARRLAMKAPCSVAMVPEQFSGTLARILVPIDFSKHSEDTLQVAVSMARQSGAECTPLHVFFNEAIATFEEYDQVLRGAEQTAYNKFVAGIDCGGVRIAPVFEEGANVPHLIERVAQRRRADLIVMGTRGRSLSASILLGSVTDETMGQTSFPLLVVKHFGAQMNVLEALLDRRFIRGGGLHTD